MPPPPCMYISEKTEINQLHGPIVFESEIPRNAMGKTVRSLTIEKIKKVTLSQSIGHHQDASPWMK